VLAATERFIVGVAALVGVDSYLGEEPAREPVRVGRSQVGVRDYVLSLPSLDPRLERDASYAVWQGVARPVANAGPARTEEVGVSVTLDGSASSAAGGHRLRRFHWTMLQ
jgi:hypothetical protein